MKQLSGIHREHQMAQSSLPSYPKKINFRRGNNKWWVYGYIFAIFALALFFTPTEGYDRYRLELRFYEASFQSEDFIRYYILEGSADYILYILMVAGNRIGLSATIFFALINSITVFLLIKSCENLFQGYQGWRRNLVILSFILSVSYISLFSGVRFYLALSLFSFFLVNFIEKKYLKSVLFLLLASLTHFSFLIFFVAFLFNFIRSRLILKTIVVITALMSLLIGESARNEVLINMGSIFSIPQITNATDAYLVQQADEVGRNFAFFMFNFFFIIPVSIYLISLKRINNHHILLFASYEILFFFVGNYSIFSRYFIVLMFISLHVLANKDGNKNNAWFMYSFFLSGFIRFLLEAVDNNQVYINSYF